MYLVATYNGKSLACIGIHFHFWNLWFMIDGFSNFTICAQFFSALHILKLSSCILVVMSRPSYNATDI
ncbi:hypothetical protein AYI70_g12328 [Smittium culicis]|uniref:Uncharacterized protein n=1 Tax=Smittium culicis TaxID=133412 RepID=A0A1R1WXW1_9FUNG|nr:hypothetical protein AYI70_g12328 [Smittium culicis]